MGKGRSTRSSRGCWAGSSRRSRRNRDSLQGLPARRPGNGPRSLAGWRPIECYYFLPEKLAAGRRGLERGSEDIADYPNPDLAIEVDISPPQVDRAGIYAALRVAEIWRLDGDRVIIERLTPEGTYEAVDASGFLPVRAEEIRRWIIEEDRRDRYGLGCAGCGREIRRKRGRSVVGRAFQPDADRIGPNPRHATRHRTEHQ